MKIKSGQNIIKTVFLSICLFSLTLFNAFSQEEQELSEETEKRTFLNTASINLELTPGFYLNPNTGNETQVGQSASPIYPLTFGFIWPDDTTLAIAPSLSFFMMNHLWEDGTAYPAEIENRTSQTFNFLLNIPLYISINFKKGVIQLAPGFTFLPRFAVLANKVSADDSGYTGSAQTDVEEINKWFWKKARFLYLSFSGVYLINLSDIVKGGPVVHVYMPLGTIFAGESIQGMIISFGMRIQL